MRLKITQEIPTDSSPGRRCVEESKERATGGAPRPRLNTFEWRLEL